MNRSQVSLLPHTDKVQLILTSCQNTNQSQRQAEPNDSRDKVPGRSNTSGVDSQNQQGNAQLGVASNGPASSQSHINLDNARQHQNDARSAPSLSDYMAASRGAVAGESAIERWLAQERKEEPYLAIDFGQKKKDD